MFKSTKGTVGVIAAVAIVAAAGWLVMGRGVIPHAGEQAAGAAQASESQAAAKLRLTLDPALFAGEAREAYLVAQKDPALLAQLHCYCGCDREIGHKDLLDCFRTRHGATCAICMGEAIEAEQLAGQGMPVEQIRDELRSRFGTGRGG
jgi:Protein of unknown function with PCYCGC motif